MFKSWTAHYASWRSDDHLLRVVTSNFKVSYVLLHVVYTFGPKQISYEVNFTVDIWFNWKVVDPGKVLLFFENVVNALKGCTFENIVSSLLFFSFITMFQSAGETFVFKTLLHFQIKIDLFLDCIVSRSLTLQIMLRMHADMFNCKNTWIPSLLKIIEYASLTMASCCGLG